MNIGLGFGFVCVKTEIGHWVFVSVWFCIFINQG